MGRKPVANMPEPEELGLPEDLEQEDTTPFLRRQRTVGVRRRTIRRFRWVLFTALVLLPVGVVGCLLAWYAYSSSQFALTSSEDVLVSGNRFVPREEILNVLGISALLPGGAGVNVFRLEIEEKRRRLESIPWVLSATVMRAFPHRLAVHIVERTPVAWVNIGGQMKLIDSEGVVLDKPDDAVYDFPVLMGLDSVDELAERRLRVAMYQEFSRQVASEMAPSGWLVSEVDLSDVDDLKALLVLGRESLRVHFGQREFRERFHNFLTLLPDVRRTQARIDTVDLRYRNQVVVSSASTPAEGPQATMTSEDVPKP